MIGLARESWMGRQAQADADLHSLPCLSSPYCLPVLCLQDPSFYQAKATKNKAAAVVVAEA